MSTLPEPVVLVPVVLVYDGACPFCAAAAQTVRIRKAVGALRIINARETDDAPLLADIRAHKLDLNTGIVVRFEGRFWHGVDALHLLAMIGSEHGWLNRLNVALFRHRRLAVIAYPLMKTVRNLSLFILRRPQI
jgi:predicted DCC family thiol-disulfide oxidoreductase YuxK